MPVISLLDFAMNSRSLGENVEQKENISDSMHKDSVAYLGTGLSAYVPQQ